MKEEFTRDTYVEYVVGYGEMICKIFRFLVIYAVVQLWRRLERTRDDGIFLHRRSGPRQMFEAFSQMGALFTGSTYRKS
ncbi:hypothetical protein YC2023_094186 [Brassica napus]